MDVTVAKKGAEAPDEEARREAEMRGVRPTIEDVAVNILPCKDPISTITLTRWRSRVSASRSHKTHAKRAWSTLRSRNLEIHRYIAIYHLTSFVSMPS
jgi:hypothetical protein